MWLKASLVFHRALNCVAHKLWHHEPRFTNKSRAQRKDTHIETDLCAIRLGNVWRGSYESPMRMLHAEEIPFLRLTITLSTTFPGVERQRSF